MNVVLNDPNNPFAKLGGDIIENIYERYLAGDKTTDLIKEFELEGVTQQNFTRLMPPKELDTPCPSCGQKSLLLFRHNRTRVQSAKHPIKECANCDYKVWPHQDLEEQLDAPKFQDLDVIDRFHLLVLLKASDVKPYATVTQLTRVIEQLHSLNAILPCEDLSSPYKLSLGDFEYRLNIHNGTGELVLPEDAVEEYEQYFRQNLMEDAYKPFYQTLVVESMQYALLSIAEAYVEKAKIPFNPSTSLLMVLDWLLSRHSPHQCAFLLHQVFTLEGDYFSDENFSWENSSALAAELIKRSDRFKAEGWGDPDEEHFKRSIINCGIFALLGMNREDIFRSLSERLTRKFSTIHCLRL